MSCKPAHGYPGAVFHQFTDSRPGHPCSCGQMVMGRKGRGVSCPECHGTGQVHTGECEVAMSGPTCIEPGCPPCKHPEVVACDECEEAGDGR